MSTRALSIGKNGQLRAAMVAGVAGVIFAAGLTLGGMIDPRKVEAFLDIGGIAAGRWDASLAFVMGGALLVSLITFASVGSRMRPWASTEFEVPTRRDVDLRLILGATLFGVGWAIAGYCPGPAFASVLVGGADVWWFVGAMVAGMAVAKTYFNETASAAPTAGTNTREIS